MYCQFMERIKVPLKLEDIENLKLNKLLQGRSHEDDFQNNKSKDLMIKTNKNFHFSDIFKKIKLYWMKY